MFGEPYLTMIKYGVIVLLTAISTWVVQDWRYTAQIETTAAAAEKAQLVAVDVEIEKNKALAAKLAADDAKYIGQLQDAQDAIDTLRVSYTAHALRLRVAANCTVNPAVATPSSTSVGDAASSSTPADSGSNYTAYLGDGAANDYFALKSGIARNETMIAELQSYIVKSQTYTQTGTQP